MTREPQEHEPPAVEEVETHGRPLETATGASIPQAVGSSRIEEIEP